MGISMNDDDIEDAYDDEEAFWRFIWMRWAYRIEEDNDLLDDMIVRCYLQHRATSPKRKGVGYWFRKMIDSGRWANG
jgi:hypothetical protein